MRAAGRAVHGARGALEEIETQQAKTSTSSAEQQEALTASERARAEAERARDAGQARRAAEEQRALAVQAVGRGDEGETGRRERKGRGGS